MREERKVVTALSADLAGSTALAEHLDPEDVREIVGGAIARMVTAVEEHGGTVKDLAGDGILALFGAPDTHEDDPERAVRAGLRIVEEVAEHARTVAVIHGVHELAVRVGIESGLVVLGPVGGGTRVEYGAIGDAPNTAARLQGATEPGTVLVGRATQRATSDRFEWGPAVEFALKGKAAPVLAFRAIRRLDTSEHRRPGRPAAMVGRDRELSLAVGVVRGLSLGAGRVVFVVGEPGIGKSRLLGEIRALVEDVGGTWLEGRCSSIGAATPYLPLRDLLRRWLGLGRSDETRATRLLADRVAASVGDRADEVRPYLTRLIGAPPRERDASALASLSADAIQFRTVEALGHLLRGLAGSGPIAVAMEDLHWADGSSVEAVRRLLPLADGHPILFVITTRDESERPSSSLLERPGAVPEVLRLDTLPDGADLELVESMVGPGVLPGELLRRLLDAGGGNPFFLEELVRSLMDGGALVRTRSGWRCVSSARVEVPQTLDRVLLARIDRLPVEARTALTAASVLGRRFDLGSLAELVGVPRLDDDVAPLLRADLVRPAESASLVFKHALVQEVAYSTLLRKQRRALHARAAGAIERVAGDESDVLPVLALHYREAGLLEQARSTHRRAAHAALKLSALPEVVQHLDDALAIAAELDLPGSEPSVADDRLLRGRTRARIGDFDGATTDLRAVIDLVGVPALDDVRTDALLELGAVVAGASDYVEAERILEDVRTRTEHDGDDRRTALALARRSIVRTNRLRLGGAVEDADRALGLARSTRDEEAIAAALDAMELAGVMLGDFDTVDRVVEELGAIHRARGDAWLLQYTLFQSCWEPLARCDWDQARIRLDEAEAIAGRIGDRGALPMYASTRCWLERSRGGYEEGLASGRTGVALADELAHPEWRSWTRGMLGRLLLDAGCHDEAERVLRAALEAAENLGSAIQLVRVTSLLAHASAGAGDEAAAFAWTDRALAHLREITAPPGAAYLQGADAPIAVAEVLVRAGRPEEAQALAEQVLAAAETSGWREYLALSLLSIGAARAAVDDSDGAANALRRALVVSGRDLPGSAWRGHARLFRLEHDGAHEDAAGRIVDGLRRGVTDASIRAGLASALQRELAPGGRRP